MAAGKAGRPLETLTEVQRILNRAETRSTPALVAIPIPLRRVAEDPIGFHTTILLDSIAPRYQLFYGCWYSVSAW